MVRLCTRSLLVLVGALLFGGLSGTPAAQAQNRPPEHIVTGARADNARSVHTADLDGDGDVDILSASTGDNKIAWHKNIDGRGTFSGQIVITRSANGARSVYAADLDGDGDVDVLSASEDDDKVAWYENRGGGNFGAQTVITTRAGGAQSVHAADLDGDGDVDVLSASEGDDKIAWYENTGGGSFSEQTIITTRAEGAQSVYAADLDGDGDRDVLSASFSDDKVAWYENKAGGSFSPQNVITSEADAAVSIHAADLDGDGDRDVLSTSVDDVAWHENTGNGSFSDRKVITTEVDGASSVYATDVDGDGDPDVLSASFGDDTIAAHMNQGGSFGRTVVVSTRAAGVLSVSAADLNGDSRPDVVSASSADSKIAWYRNQLSQGQGFGDQHILAAQGLVEDPSSVRTTDLDGDGDRDVLFASSAFGDSKIAWHENTDGRGTFSRQNTITTEVEGASSAVAADLDGDGDRDVLSASFRDDKVAWYENMDGTGTFSGQNVITTSASKARSVVAADLNGDGALDVLSASSGEIAWYENAGGGSFSGSKRITTRVEQASSVHAADLDGDGDPDVLSASRADDKIAWYENTGGGAFADQTVITTAALGARSVYTADVDADADPDVLSASSFDDRIAWYENTEDGFGTQQVIASGAKDARSVYAADVNADGTPDVLSASEDGVFWYDGSTSSGVTSFVSQRIDTEAGRAVHASDIDGDGDRDVLAGVSALPDDKIVWYENTSTTLPVELVDFEARVRGSSDAVLTWTTTSERGNAGFEVQHRPGGTGPWSVLGFVGSKAPGGNASEPLSYRFAAEDLSPGSHQFRLTQVDLDGSTTLSDPVSVDIQMRGALRLTAPTPNPVTGTATFSFAVKTETAVTIAVYDVLGQRVRILYEGTPPAGERRRLHFDASGLASGVYVLRLKAQGRTRTRRVTVVR